jgi:hypothetical protein
MNDSKTYLIEILLRAREQVTQAAQRATTALNKVTNAQREVTEEAKRNDEANRKQVGSLEQLRQARVREKRDLDDSIAAMRAVVRARRDEAEAARKSLEQLQSQARVEKALATERERRDREEVTRLRRQVAERQASGAERTREFNAETRDMRNQAALLEAQAREESAINVRRAAQTDLEIARRQQSVRDQQFARRRQSGGRLATSRMPLAASGATSPTSSARSSASAARRTTARAPADDFATSLRTSARSRTGFAASGVRGLNSEFQGFQVALFIKYIQSILSVAIALAGQLFAVASAAAQAGAGLAGALAAGAAQAVPVIGVLAAALLRVKNVLQAVKLQNQQQLTATKDATSAAQRQRTAAEQVASAQQQVADAHRNTARTIQQAAQTTEDAQRQERPSSGRRHPGAQGRHPDGAGPHRRRAAGAAVRRGSASQPARASRSGDIAGVAQAQLGLQEAHTTQTRAQQDAAPVRARGVEGVDAVQQAEQRLADTRRQNARQEADASRTVADAQRAERRAQQDLARVRRDSTANLQQETAAVDKLADTLKQLSPAERELYTHLLRLQDVYKRVSRPITDIITRSFTGVVDAITTKLQDPRIIRGFRNIAVQIAGSIRTATREAGGPASTNAFEILSAEAARNIPIATRILVNFFRAARNLVLDAVPAFRLLLRYVEGYSSQALNASRNSRGFRDFFVEGVRMANSFFKLGLAVLNLFLAIAGPGGAAHEGLRTIDSLTGIVDGLTAKVRSHASQVRGFFRATGGVLHDVIRVIGAIGTELIRNFSPRSVKALSDFLVAVIIPAIGNTIGILGGLVNAFHELASLPGVSTVLQIGATMLLLGKGLAIISEAVTSLTGILPALLSEFGLLTVVEAEAAGGAEAVQIALGGWILLAVLALVAAVVLLDRKFHFLGPTFRWIKGVATDAFNALKGAGKAVLSYFSDVWTQGLLYWIRWPFVKLFQLVPWDRVFGAIKTAAMGVYHFFSRTGGGGVWNTLRDVITSPFRGLIATFKAIFRAIKDVVLVVLDVIAGRFGDAGQNLKDLFSGVLDTIAGAATTFLGIWQGILDALSHVPGFGWARGAANAIKSLRGEMDDWRKTLRHSKDDQNDSTKAVKDSLPHLVRLHDRYENATNQLEKLRPGTDSYKDAVKRADKAHQNYNDSLRDTAKKAGGAQAPVSVLKGNIQSLGDTSADTARAVAEDLNAVLKEVGAKRISVRVQRRDTPRHQAVAPDRAAGGGVLGASGLRRRLFAGGIPNPYGSAADDHLVLSPSGAPIAAFSGSEGIVNTPQMGVINTSLSLNKAMGMLPWGSLDELWGSGMRHYQTGGGLQPAIRSLSNRLDRMFGLTTTSTTEGHHATNSYHYRGLAADISGTPQAMARASRYIMSSGIWHSLLEGIHDPGLSIKNGQRVDPSFWGAATWAQHMNHIHLALSTALGALGAAAGRVRQPRIIGPPGLLRDVATGGARTLTRAANRYLERVLAQSGGGDVRAQGAEANVVAAFRRAVATMQANRTERLALFEAGLVESGLRNLHFGDADSLGSLQERASIYGRGHALNPYASAIRFLTQAKALRPWRGSAGMLAAAVQRPAAQFRGRYDQVRGSAQRFLQTGGTLTGRRGPTFPSVLPTMSALRGPLRDLQDFMISISQSLESLARGPLRRSKDLSKRIRNAFEHITEDGGVLDQMSTAVEGIATRAQVALQNRQFRVGRGGPRRVYQTPAQLAQANLRTLQATRVGLVDEQTTIEENLAAAHRALHEAQRRKDKRAAALARGAITNLSARLDKNRADMAQNAQDQVEAQETFQQALVDGVNNCGDAADVAPGSPHAPGQPRWGDQLQRHRRPAPAAPEHAHPTARRARQRPRCRPQHRQRRPR